jgi:hypothetical protein
VTDEYRPEHYRPDGPQPAPYDPCVVSRLAAPEEQPYPAPTITSRDGVFPDSPPRAFIALQMALHAAGWRTLVQYAHGSMPHSTTSRPLAAKPSWALRLERGGIGAVAVYRGGAWDALYTWSATQPHRKFPNITSFRAEVLTGA